MASKYRDQLEKKDAEIAQLKARLEEQEVGAQFMLASTPTLSMERQVLLTGESNAVCLITWSFACIAQTTSVFECLVKNANC